MSFYVLFFLISLIGVELSSISLRLVRYDVSFMDASFYLGDIQGHLLNLGCVAFIVAIYYVNKGKIEPSAKRRTYKIFSAVSSLYFFSVFLILLYAYISSEAVKRLSLSSLVVGCALLSLIVISFNVVSLIKFRDKKL